MASKSRARSSSDDEDDERGAGGKMVHSRRPVQSPSPYLRPVEERSLALVPSSQEETSRGWFSGILSGAGRLISSVFGSDSGSSSCSCSSDSEYDLCEESDEDEHGDASHRDVNEMDQPGTELILDKDQVVGNQLLASTSQTKVAIEKLLRQESFSRDECNRLVEIIQSRVVDFPEKGSSKDGIPKALPDRAFCSKIASPRFIGSSEHSDLLARSPCSPICSELNSELLARSPYSPICLNTLYPSSFADRANLCDNVIMEAKKWVEEKKSKSGSKTDLSCGPCTLNTDMFHTDSEGDGGSPIDMAKSYMRALPPWRSPVIGRIDFRTPTSAESLENCENPYPFADRSSHALKAKRRYLSGRSWETLDTSRNVCQKTAETTFHPSARSIDSYKKTPEPESLQTSLRAQESVPQNVSAAYGTASLQSRDFPDALFSMKDGCTDGSLGSPGEDAVRTKFPLNNGTCTESGNCSFDNAVPMLNAGGLRRENSVETTLPPEKNQVVNSKEALPTKEQLGAVAIHEIITADSSLLEHNGDLVEDVLNAEPIAMVSENINYALSRSSGEVADVTDLGASGLRKNSELEKTGRGNNSSGEHSSQGLNERVASETRLHGGNDRRHRETVRSVSKATTKGISSSRTSAGLKAADRSIGSLNTGDHNAPNTSNGSLGANVPVDTCKLSSGASLDVVDGNGSNTIVNKTHLGITMKSIKQMLRELPPESSRSRGRKTVARSRRGRGRGK